MSHRPLRLAISLALPLGLLGLAALVLFSRPTQDRQAHDPQDLVAEPPLPQPTPPRQQLAEAVEAPAAASPAEVMREPDLPVEHGGAEPTRPEYSTSVPDAADPLPAVEPMVDEAEADELAEAAEPAVDEPAAAEPAVDGPALAAALGAPVELAKAGFGPRDLTDIGVFHATQHHLLAAVNVDDPAAMQALRARLLLADQRRQNQLRRLAHERGIPFQEVTAHGGRRLMGLHNGEPVYMQTANVEAAETTGAHLVRRNTALDPIHGAGIDGSGFSVQIHDFGHVFDHEEFKRADGSSRLSWAYDDFMAYDHATHVTGTLIAAGKDPSLQGMAPAAEAVSMAFFSPGYMSYYAMGSPYHTDQTIIGNVSLGQVNTPGGGYTADDAFYDALARAQPYFLLFLAAGNEGDWGTVNGHGYPKEAKNSVVIGALSDVDRDAAGRLVSGGEIRHYSSRGPNDDGRIKPDLMANGGPVLSTAYNFIEDPPWESTTSQKTGTSMACPNAAGSALLLQDYHKKLFGAPMPAQTLKALLIHSADDRGIAGPDYSYGWGLVNVHAAALILRGAADGSMPRAIGEASLDESATFQRRFTWDGSSPLRATCVWWDPALPEDRYADNADDLRDPHLVNDLDLRLIAPDGSVHQPYVMPYVTGGFAESDIETPATIGDNTTDSVEMVALADPVQTGEWTVQVSHKGSLEGGSQSFSLILTGVGSASAEPQLAGVTPASGSGRGLELRISGADLQAGSTLRLLRGGTAIAGSHPARTRDGDLLARFDLRGAEAGHWDLEVHNPDGTSSTLANAFQVRPILASYLDEDFEDGFDLAAAGWSSGAEAGSDAWQITSARSASSDRSLFAPAVEAITDSWVRSPTVTVDEVIQGDLRLAFEQYSATEAHFDAVLCEIQVDGGDWEDITAYGSFVSGGYTGIILADQVERESVELPYEPNPLAGRQAWFGRSGGWMTTMVDLDKAALAGRQVALRWRHGADWQIAKEGWYLDDVTLGDEGSAPQEFRQITITSDPASDPGWMITPAAPHEVPVDDGQRFEQLDRQQDHLLLPQPEPGAINN